MEGPTDSKGMYEAEAKKGLLLLFKRPLEPVFTLKDKNEVSLDLPPGFLGDDYKDVANPLNAKPGVFKIRVKPLATPDLSFAKSLGRKEQFSLFNEGHKQIACRLIEILIDAPGVPDFLCAAAYTRDRVNPAMFQYAFMVAMQHRPDTNELQIPSILEIFPQLFMDPSIINKLKEEANIDRNNPKKVKVEIPEHYTASDLEVEQRLAYFREDIGINVHHWHWHLVFPGEGPKDVVDKDRRGELFFYMHHQMMARYNVERFSNKLDRVRPFSKFSEPLQEAYFPKILSSLNNRTYPARSPDSRLKDINRKTNVVTVADMTRWKNHIIDAIQQGFVVDTEGTRIPLDPVKGIDILGNIVEASILSPNPSLYGSLHNMGHNMISLVHDPDNRHLEDFGVMGDVTTAVRDPAFYRWHAFIDRLFYKHKNRLPQYTDSELSFKNITVDDIVVKIKKKDSSNNVLLTYKQKTEVDLDSGLDFGPNKSVYFHFGHMQHAPFTYNINVTNNSDAACKGTCRIFICPTVDNRGQRFELIEAKDLMIELDRFTVSLTPGQNIIIRDSGKSAVTIPFDSTFRRVEDEDNRTSEFKFCGCGWPDHMLLPRGSLDGTLYDMFVMISDFKDDEVLQANQTVYDCDGAFTFCGLKDRLYPDKRSMGFPFDRVYCADTLAEFVGKFPNMKSTEVTIKFNNLFVERETA